MKNKRYQIGDLNKGKHLPQDVKEKISKALSGKTPWNKNREWDAETRKKIALTKKRQYKSGEIKLPDNTGRTPWNKGKKWNQEVKEKIAASKQGQTPWNKGKKWNQEVKEKIAKSKRKI